MAFLHKFSDGSNTYFVITEEAKNPISGKTSVSLDWKGKAKGNFMQAIKDLRALKEFSKEEKEEEETKEKGPAPKLSSIVDYIRELVTKANKE